MTVFPAVSRLSRRCLLPLAALLLVAAGAFAAPLPDAKADDDKVSLNFANADIDTVIRAVGRITGRNFLVDPRVKGNLNIVTNAPVPRDLAYQILVSSLRLQGYAAVEGEGGIVKIVPEADAKLQGGPVNPGRRVKGDRLVTQVFTLVQEPASQMLTVIRPLVSPNNSVTAFASNNTLVVTDYAENIERIRRIIESIDVVQADVAAIELQHAAALDVASAVNRLLAPAPGNADSAQRVQVVAEPSTNTLLIKADNPARIAAVRQIVAVLDKPGAAGNIHVVYLKNADATRVARTLASVLGKSDGSAASGSTATSGGLSPAPVSNDSTTNSGSTTSAALQPLASSGGASFGGGANAGSGGGIVQANPDSNAIIITAPESVYRNLRGVIDELDRRRAQVYIEALIAEVSSDKAAEFGVQWLAGGANGNGSVGVIGGTAFSSGGDNLYQLATGKGTLLPGNGLTLAASGGQVNIPGIGNVATLSVLARFLESETKANILSTPNIVTLDNEEAKIVVGSNLPFVTGQYSQVGSAGAIANPFQTIERHDVGLTLRVKPQISEGGVIRLAIYQEDSAVVDGTTSNQTGPTTTKRSIESTVLVDDGSIIALGGLMEDSYSGTKEKIPVLGDLPGVGPLFSYDSRKRSKTSLVIFLRPVILRTQADYADMTRSRYDYIIGQQKTSTTPRDQIHGDTSGPEMPPLPSVPAAVSTASQQEKQEMQAQ